MPVLRPGSEGNRGGLLVRILMRLVPREYREYVAGDLEEGYAARAAAHGRLRARLWYWRQALESLAAFLAHGGRGGGWGSDIVRGVRALTHSPGFAAASIGTLALGIGSVTAMFTVLDQVVLRPLPVRDQDRLVVAWNYQTLRDIPHFPIVGDARGDVYERIAENISSLEAVAAHQWKSPIGRLVEMEAGHEEVLEFTRVLGDFFGVLGVVPVLGRTLRPEDDVAGASRVAVISDQAWTRHYGRSPDAVGSVFRTVGADYTVVGVLPPGFDYPRNTDVWVSLRAEAPSWIEVDLVARLRPGASTDGAAAEIAALYRTLPEQRSGLDGAVPVVKRLDEVILGDLRATVVLLFAGSLLVLLTACVNVANLVEVRAAGREATVAIRRALGASRWRLVRESLAEAWWLGVLGGVGGAMVGALAVRFLMPHAPQGLARVDEVTPLDATTLFVAAGVTALVVLLCAALPVLRAEKVGPAVALRGAARSTSGLSTRRRGIVVVQAAFAVWSAAVGVLLLRSLLELERLDPGFRIDDLALVQLEVPYRFFELPEDFPDRLAQIQARAAEHPAIEAVTPIQSRPLDVSGGVVFVPQLERQTAEEAHEQNPMTTLELVQPDYFETLELAIVRGRAPLPSDDRGAPPIVVVNEAAARLLWPGEEALGKRLVAPAFPGQTKRWWTVVGVSRNARYLDWVETQPIVYVPLRQLNAIPPSLMLVRTTAGMETVLAVMRDAVAAVDPEIRVMEASSLRARLEAPLARPRFAVLILGALSGTTLLLAAVGIYGVMAAAVRARTPEMGVRMACGATPSSVRTLVLRQGLRLAAGGVALGTAAVLAGGSLLESLLFQVAPSDTQSLAVGALLVLAVALCACWTPAARAARLDPVRALRAE